MERELNIGSPCTGYGGLDIAALAVFGGTLIWCADNDKHVSTILAARYPDVPNLGDVTTLDWAEVPAVDVLCAGFPCQDISFSGRGLGIEKGVRSGIWKNIVSGIRIIQPTVIIVENVAAIRHRRLGRVLGDLAACRYDASWTSLRASDVGAAHRRERVFVLAYRPDKESRNILAAAYARGQRWQRRTASGQTESRRPSGGPIRDLSGQMANATGGLIPLVVTDYPDADPDRRVRIEVTPDELEKIGKLSIAAVGLETEPTNEEEKRSRFVVPLAKLATLATVAPIEEVLANAEPIVPSKPQRRPRGEETGERRSHNQRADGGPLVNYNDPENAGLPHKGKIGEAEAAFVRDNLELVNERRTAAGHDPIDPSKPEHAKRYGFGT
jgi:site-specific DNA-cytosine methylase